MKFLPPKTVFLNKFFSWLAFNKRILQEAENDTHPLLERLRFLSISARNLEEFLTIQVPKLLDKSDQSFFAQRRRKQQLERLYAEIKAFKQKQQEVFCYLKTLLAKEKIFILEKAVLTLAEKKFLKKIFFQEIWPKVELSIINTRSLIDYNFKTGLLYLVAYGWDRQHGRDIAMIVECPSKWDRLLSLPSNNNSNNFIPLETIFYLFLKQAIPQYKLFDIALVRVLRNARMVLKHNDISAIQHLTNYHQQKAPIIALELSCHAGALLKQAFFSKGAPFFLSVEEEFLQLYGFEKLYQKAPAHLTFRPFLPHYIWVNLYQSQELLLHHPYDSFKIIIDLLKRAAISKEVESLTLTLYRTDCPSPIIEALIKAAYHGKKVLVILELRARLSEAENSYWVQYLRQAGVEVVFGPANYKLHAKILLICCRNGKKHWPIIHISTGNYNSQTAKLYTDLAFISYNQELSSEVKTLFNSLAKGKIPTKKFKYFFIAPQIMHKIILRHIKQEVKHAKQGKYAAIFMKLNTLTDRKIIKALYWASQNGVKIYLIVRGICTLRPQVKGLSEGIFVTSVVGRFLEHSRFFCFANGAPFHKNKAKIFLCSADMRPRNLQRRIEILLPILNPVLKEKLLVIMYGFLSDKKGAYRLLPSGEYQAIRDLSHHKQAPFSAQDYFLLGEGINSANLSEGKTIHSLQQSFS